MPDASSTLEDVLDAPTPTEDSDVVEKDLMPLFNEEGSAAKTLVNIASATSPTSPAPDQPVTTPTEAPEQAATTPNAAPEHPATTPEPRQVSLEVRGGLTNVQYRIAHRIMS